MEPEVPEKVNINGQEYDPTEAQSLIELGNKTREAETKYNITFDSIMPAYSKATERAKLADTLETELQEARNQLQTFQQKQEAGTDTPNDLAKAKAAARELGLTFQEDLEKGEYIKKSDLDKYLSQRDSEREALNKVLSEADRLEKEIDGSDGRPKFNKKVVLAYASAYGIADLQKAYEDMHGEQITAWKDAQIAQSKKPGLKTLSASQGNKEPKEVRPTKDNIDDLLSESLWGSKE